MLRRFLRRVVEDNTRLGRRGHDKRRYERHLCMTEAQVQFIRQTAAKATFENPLAGPEVFTMFTKDISRSGISFVHEQDMQRDDIIRVNLDVKGVIHTYYLKIVRSRRAGLKIFDIAGEFVTEEEAKSFQSAAKPAGN